MKLKITAGTTSKLARIFIQDSSATDGSGLTGLVYNSAGLTWYWIQDGDAAPTAVTPATATVGTWTSGGFAEVDSISMPGVYELGLPDVSIDAHGTTHMLLKGATNMAPVAIEIECDAFTYLSANATAASIAALNDVSTADVNAQCDLAISDAALATAASIAALNDVSVNDLLYTALTESYATKGSQPTLAQSVYMIQQGLLERSVEDVTETVKTLSGASAATFTLDSATTPKSKVRAT